MGREKILFEVDLEGKGASKLGEPAGKSGRDYICLLGKSKHT